MKSQLSRGSAGESLQSQASSDYVYSEFQASLGFRVSPSLKKERKEISSQAALLMLLTQRDLDNTELLAKQFNFSILSLGSGKREIRGCGDSVAGRGLIPGRHHQYSEVFG